MSEGADSRLGAVARWLSRGLGAALVLWAISDDPLIGGAPGFGLAQVLVAAIGLGLAASSFAPLAWNARALALVLSTGFVLVVGEIGVRIVFSARYQRPYHLHEQLIYRLTPGAVREYQREAVNGGERLVYRINRQGYRGEDLRDDAELRIAVYGDSFIQGEFSALEATFTERLEHHVSERSGLDVEVVNAGVAGYGPGQVLRKMELELPELDPDLLVVAIFAGNDFGDLLRNKLVRLDEAGRLVANDFVIGPEVRRGFALRRRELMLKRVLRDAGQTLAYALGLADPPTDALRRMTARERLDHFLAAREEEYRQFVLEGDDVVHALAADTYDADLTVTPDAASARYKIRLMEGVIGEMQALAASRGVPFVLVVVPHPIDVGGHDTAEVDPSRHPHYTPRAMVDALERSGARRSIPTLELFTPFRERGSKAVYFQGFDDHWNDPGQDLAAELLAGFLETRQLVEAARSGARRKDG